MANKNILIISGSPRNGNTDFILSDIYQSITSPKELVRLRDLNIRHCIGCLRCHDEPKCTINDDMTQLLDKVLLVDVLILGTPNYFDNVSGLMKDFTDRCHPFYKSKSIKDKKVVLVYVGGGDKEITRQALDQSFEGFVKYLGLDLVGSYSFQALNVGDLTKTNMSNQMRELMNKLMA